MNQRQREIEDEVTRLLPARKGHFLLESGHHGDLWLNLELLCLQPERIRGLAAQIAARLTAHNVEVVCGPLVEGAFVALMVAEKLGLPFTYAERFADVSRDDLYPVRYRLPRALRDVVRGRRVAIVNDVVNAGSAIRGTFSELRACSAVPVVIATLAVLGKSAARFAAHHKLALVTITSIPNEIWIPAECPLCRRSIPLENFLNTRAGVA
jgi:orotate phosphoribosyltransferase